MKRLAIMVLILVGVVTGYSRLDGLLYTGSARADATFVETFNGAPGGPAPFVSDRWEVNVHGRDNRDLLRQYNNAAHGPDCGAPPATHPTGGRFENTVFQCRDHVMTAMHGDGYAVAYLTPNHMVDFSQGEAVVRWDMSTHRSSERDWIDVWITPFEDNLQLPLNPGFPDLQGPPRRAIQILMRNNEGAFCPNIWLNAQRVADSNGCRAINTASIPGFPGLSATRRDTVEVRLSRTHLKIGMPAYNYWWYDGALPLTLDWSRGVVQFGHHSYSPEKGTHIQDPTTGVAGPNTWHWDNVTISPAVPFTIIKGDKRAVAGSGGSISAEAATVRFARPAPANAFLRFSAWNRYNLGPIEYSTDGGTTWQVARKAVQGSDDSHIYNYWTPIAAGATAVRFRAPKLGWPYDGMIKDITIWCQTTSGLPLPTATPTSTALPPTATPTRQATATPVPPTATPTRQATSTPAPAPATPRTTTTPVPPTATPRATNTPAPATATPRATTTPPPATQTPVPATATPRPTNTPAPVTATPTSSPLSFTTTARVSPTSVVAGQTESITATVRSSQTVTVLVDVEVYDAAGRKVYQRFYDNVALTAGVSRTFTTNWVVPATQASGTYTVKVGVFRPGWGTLLHWNNAARTFAVTRP